MKTKSVWIGKEINSILRDFTQDKKLISGIFTDFHKFSIDEGDYDEKRLIRYLFKKFLGFTIADQPIEKVNWEIPFKYKNILGSFAHQKFGFRVYLDKRLGDKDAEIIFDEIVAKVDKCLILVQPLIREYGVESLKKGELVVENRLHEIEKEYNFFFNESRRKIKKSNIPDKLSLSSKLGHLNFKLSQESRYMSNATCISFFSLIEHLCVLGLAFTNSSEKYNLERFSRKTWQDKFKVVFSLKNTTLNDYYNKFVDLAKYRRNPTAHGYLGKANTIFYFYLPEARHKIPMDLYDRELVFNLEKDENLSMFASFLKEIRKIKESKKWMRYLDSGLNVSYDTESLKEYEHLMKSSEQEIRSYIEYQARLSDDLGNMDW